MNIVVDTDFISVHYFVWFFFSYVNASLWKYMEKHKVKQESKAFQLVRSYCC